MQVKLRPQRGEPTAQKGSLLDTIKADKAERWSHPLGSSFMAVAKFGLSGIPFASWIADDATLARFAQVVDPGFELMYDKRGTLDREAYHGELVRRLGSQDERERATANLLISHLRRHIKQQARARKAVPFSRTRYSASAMSQNRKLLQHLEKQHGALKFLAKDSTRLANPAAINPFARRFGEYKANFAAVRKKMRN